MPKFSFSIKKKEAKNTNDKTKYIILEKNVCGVIFITLQASYYVLYNTVKYNIKPECYSCKGYTKVFRQGERNNKVPTVYIRHADYSHHVSSLYWLPFSPGIIVYGNIVKSMKNNKIYFSIKTSEINYKDPIAKTALDMYKMYHKEITDIQYNNLLNICNGI